MSKRSSSCKEAKQNTTKPENCRGPRTWSTNECIASGCLNVQPNDQQTNRHLSSWYSNLGLTRQPPCTVNAKTWAACWFGVLHLVSAHVYKLFRNQAHLFFLYGELWSWRQSYMIISNAKNRIVSAVQERSFWSFHLVEDLWHPWPLPTCNFCGSGGNVGRRLGFCIAGFKWQELVDHY